jgi:DNA-binding NarL/FixJ family response regulator
VTVRVVVAEDHPMFREGLRALLDAHDGIEVVGAVAGGRAAVSAVVELGADVVVLDLSMPDGDGLEAASALHRVSPKTRVLVLTSSDSEREVSGALAAGAHGYLLKSAEPREIVDAVVAVASGSAVLSDEVLALVARRASGPAGLRGSRPFPELTDRELEVLEVLAEGKDNAEIARRLGLSLKTVRNYVSNILVKLGARDRAAAVVEAHRLGVGMGQGSS